MAEISSVSSTIIDSPPSCIEFLPSDNSYVFIGTYALEKNEHGGGSEIQEVSEPVPQKRTGTVMIMHLQDDIL
jgi:hypothetical protein